MKFVFSAKNITSANKGDQTIFLVTCLGACRDVGISLEVADGDADLYARFVYYLCTSAFI